MKSKLTQERLKELLDYDPDTGLFTWRVNKGRGKIGLTTGYTNNRGYSQIGIDGKFYISHRLAFLYMEGYFPENGIDHIDRDKLNNRWKNLREVSQLCNTRNRSIRIDNKTGVVGVRWRSRAKKWNAYIRVKKCIHLGSFNNFIDAVKARWDAEVKYNFPTCNTTSSAFLYLKDHEAV